MAEPNPILGVHVAPLATAWAQVRREADGSYRVLAWRVEKAPADATQAVAAAAEIAARRPFRGRGTFLAVPDGSGCLVTATMPPEELDLSGDDLVRELHEYTPFEPGVAALRHRHVRTEGRRKDLLVAALPVAQERRFLEAIARRDDGTIGLGFSGAALLRGVAALGLAPRPSFVLEMLPATTHVYAYDEHRVRRYLVAAGADDVIAAAAKSLGRDAAAFRAAIDAGTTDAAADEALTRASADLAEDARAFAKYHVAQQYAPKDPPDGLPEPQFAAAGPVLHSAPLRRALAAHLGASFADASPRAAPAERIAWDQPAGPDAAALSGAVGAALEAFAAADQQMALRGLPRELPEVRGVARWALPAAAVLVVGLAGAAWWSTTTGTGTTGPSRPEEAGPKTTHHASPVAPVDDAARAVALLRAADSIADVSDVPLDVSAAHLEWTGEGYRVTLRVATSGSARLPVVARLAPGAEGEVWTPGRRTAESATFEGRWFIRKMPVPAPESLGPEGAPRLGAALDAWRAARTARTRALGGTVTTDPKGARLVEVPGGSIAGAVALADAADVIDVAARRSQDRGSWLDTSAVCGRAEAVQSVRARRGEDEVRSSWTSDPTPPAPPEAPTDAGAFTDRVAAALRAPAPRTADRWAPDLTLTIGPSAAGAKLRWAAGGPRMLQRRDPGDAAWIDADDIGTLPGEHVSPAAELQPGRRWRLVDAGSTESRAGVSLEVLPTCSAQVEALGVDAAGAPVRLRLCGNGTDGPVAVEGLFAVGDPIRAQVEGARLVLDSECRLRGTRVREEPETVQVSVPRFLPDGRVERGSDGAPVRGFREERRPARWLDVECEDAAGNVRRLDSRKMTDG